MALYGAAKAAPLQNSVEPSFFRSFASVTRPYCFVAAGAIAVDEVTCAHALLAFDLQFVDLESGSVSKSKQKTPVLDHEMASFDERDFRSRHRRMQVQRLAAKRGERPRPRLKSTQAVPGLSGRAREIDEAIFPRQNGREGCLRMVLRLGADCSVDQPGERANHQFRTGFCQPGPQGERGVVRLDGLFGLHQNVASVETGIEPHDGYAGYRLAIGDRPLD